MEKNSQNHNTKSTKK